MELTMCGFHVYSPEIDWGIRSKANAIPV